VHDAIDADAITKKRLDLDGEVTKPAVMALASLAAVVAAVTQTVAHTVVVRLGLNGVCKNDRRCA
jgi:hypothetical protein